MSDMVQGVSSKAEGPKEGTTVVCTAFQGSSRISGVEFTKWRLFASPVMEVNLENVSVMVFPLFLSSLYELIISPSTYGHNITQLPM